MKKKLLFTLLGVLMALPALARNFSYEYEGQNLSAMRSISSGAEIGADNVNYAKESKSTDYVAYFDNSDSNWDEVYVYTWTGGTTHSGGWPGTRLTETIEVKGETYYVAHVPVADPDTMIIFNNGEGEQTADLHFEPGAWYNRYRLQGILTFFDFNCEYEGQTLTYSVTSEEDKTVMIKKHNDVSGNLIIPEIVKDGDVEYTVTTIGSYAFNGCGNLKQVIIPGSVTNISETAFQNCNELRKAIYPSTIGFDPFEDTGDDYVSWGYNPENENPIEDIIKYGCFYDSEEKKELQFVSLFYTGVFNIPDTVEKIGNYAFYDCSGLTSVTIPNSVKTIGDRAFQSCENLTSITLPNSLTAINSYAFSKTGLISVEIPSNVTSIGEGAFWDCSGLTSVTIGNSVESIGLGVFLGCIGLTEVTIPNSVKTIDVYAFQGCENLTSITLSKSLTAINNYAFSKTGLISVEIPSSVTSIGEGAFWDCGDLTSVIIPEFVTSIGSMAFWGCSGLTSVTIPNSVKTIDVYAFQGCENLTSITLSKSLTAINNYAFSKTGLISVEIPSSVTSIGEGAFWDCGDLTSVIIPEFVTSIGSMAFWGCSGLTSVTIPNSVTSIGNYAFLDCRGLTSLAIGNSVESIGEEAFLGCNNIRKVACTDELSDNFSDIEIKIVYDKTNSRIEDGFVFSRRKDHIYFAPTTLSGNYKLPETVETIGDGAFAYCDGLTSVKLNDALTSIGEKAFAECNSISVVEYPSTTPAEAPGNIFTTSVYDHATLYVPEGSVKIYEKTTPWNYFYDIKEMDFSTISVSSLSFKQSSYTAEIGETINLNDEVEILPADATDKSLSWKSSDESVATVSNGVVTVLSVGSCEITATTTDGSEISTVCTINAYSGVVTISTDELCDVYSMSGILVQRNIKLDEATSLIPGIYIVRQGNAVKKIAVK